MLQCTTHSVTATPTPADSASSQQAAQQHLAFGAVDEGLHRALRLGHREHAQDARRRAVTGAATYITEVLSSVCTVARGARAVLAAQRARHVAPAE
jgi:hypothetical protein